MVNLNSNLNSHQKSVISQKNVSREPSSISQERSLHWSVALRVSDSSIAMLIKRMYH
jgi:hypothetical protein